jgi:type II secretory pathway component PulM
VKLPTALRGLTPLARKIIFGMVLVAIILVLVALNSCQTARTAKTEAKLSDNQTTAAIASGADAANTVGDVGARAAETDRTTMENTDEIRSARGADAPVDSDVHGAGMRSLCKRAAYRGDPECLQQPAAR